MGNKVVAALFSFLILSFLSISPVFASTWLQQTAQGQQRWNRAAGSANGDFIAASAYDNSGGFYHSGNWHYDGTVWISTDNGDTWTEQSGPGFGFWSGVAISSDGMHLAVVGCDEVCTAFASSTIWISQNGGTNWTQSLDPPAQEWNDIAISGDGSHLFLSSVCILDNSCYGGYLWASTDGGVTWTQQNAPGEQAWDPVAVSADGLHMIAGSLCASIPDCDSFDGTLWTSSDGGTTWTHQTAPGAKEWESVAISADGSRLVAVSACYSTCDDDSFTGTIWVSSDGGTTWTETDPDAERWWGVAMSPDGMHLAVIGSTHSGSPYDSDVWISSDGGMTWTKDTSAPLQGWAGVGLSEDGSKIVVAPRRDELGNNSYLYVATLSPTLTTSAASSIAATSATLNGSITDTGYASSTVRGFVYGTDTSYGATTTESGSFGTGTFTANLSSLPCATTYHVVAYANNGDLAYGSDQSFTTGACPSNGPIAGGGGGSLTGPEGHAVIPGATTTVTTTTVTSPTTLPAAQTRALISLYTSLLQILEQEIAALKAALGK